jgi:hypothetical protein
MFVALEIKKMRIMQMKSPLILSLLLACSLSEIAHADWYKSTAEPSLVVRDAPDISGKKLDNIPVGGKINVLERIGKEESIGGNNGHWVKIQWKDKIAYAFDAFLTPLAIPETTSDATPSVKSKRSAGKGASIDDVLDQVYEGFDTKNDCRRYHADRPDAHYCMKVDRLDTLTTEEGVRTYVLLSGELTNAGGAAGSHVDAGLVGALVIGEGENGVEIIAGDPGISIAAFGRGPTKWEFVKLGPSNYWGWKNTWGDAHQGIGGSRHSILAPYGKKIQELAGFVESYSDEGYCDEASGCKVTSYDSTLKIDSTQIGEKVFPLVITVTGKEKGKPIPEKTWTLPFDVKKWEYVEPKDWPLMGLEF